MKKWVLSTFIIVVIGIAAIYIFIPQTLNLSVNTTVACNGDGAFRFVSQPANWKKWVNEKVETKNFSDEKNGTYLWKDDTLHLLEVMPNIINTKVNDQNLSSKGSLLFFAINKDSVMIRWQSDVHTGNNPIYKLIRYSKAVTLHDNMAELLNSMRHFIEKPANVYGYAFNLGTFSDTTLVASSSLLKVYPGTDELYQTIQNLQKYIGLHNATQTAPPIVNVTQQPDGVYKLMVAIPVNEKLENNNTIFYRKMIPGNFLVTDVTGGDKTIQHAFAMMEIYINDHELKPIAIPFASLITDRTTTTDTTQWMTRLYYPIL